LGSVVFATAAANGGTTTGTGTAATALTWVSDKKYIMWKEGSKWTANATDFISTSQANQNGFDSNYNSTLLLSLASSVLEIAVIVLGWGPFGKWYQYQAELAAEEDEEDGEDEEEGDYASEDAYDAYGCNADGLDVYGNECPAPEY
jgi:hypothetical protein